MSAGKRAKMQCCRSLHPVKHYGCQNLSYGHMLLVNQSLRVTMGIKLVPAPVDCFACAGGQEPLCTSLAAGAIRCSGELGLPGTGECLSSLLTARLAGLGDRGGLL